VTGPVDVAMLVAIVDEGRKAIGSTEAMLRSSRTSPAWPSWIDASEGWVRDALTALAASDLPAVGAVMERSTLLMHAMAWTSNPPIVYWRPATLALWHAVSNLRAEGVGAWATMDAGPQVKVLTAAQDAETVAAALAPHALRVVRCAPGPDASVT
jgi:diphosphomevalonate decarboxylase